MPNSPMAPSFRMSWAAGPDGTLGLAVQGAITETFDVDQQFRAAGELIDVDFETKPTELVIDVDGVKRFNSIGVKKWIEFIQRAQQTYRLRFLVLPSAFIEMARMIPGVLGKAPARVKNFRVPYACGQCKTFFSVLGEVAALGRDGTWKEHRRPCEKCGGQAELDALAQEYFWFLTLCERSTTPQPIGAPSSGRPSSS